MRNVSTVTLSTGLTLSYADQGDPSGPALLLLPGPTDAWRSYQPVLERLPQTIHTIAVSQRGHGDSDKPASGYGVEDFAADVGPLLDALHVERAVLAGHSGSCLVARRVAIDRPERVAGLVLEGSPSTLRGHAGLEDFVTSVVSNVRDRIDPDLARSIITDTSSDDIEPAMIDQFTDDLLKVPAHVWQEMFADLLLYDDLAELEHIDVPTLLVWGDADAIVPRAMQEQLVERISGAELVVYPAVGHTPRWEDPSQFASDVANFVGRGY